MELLHGQDTDIVIVPKQLHIPIINGPTGQHGVIHNILRVIQEKFRQEHCIVQEPDSN